MSATEVLAAVASAQLALLLALAIALGRSRERIVKLEEWARLVEKRLNGKDGH